MSKRNANIEGDEVDSYSEVGCQEGHEQSGFVSQLTTKRGCKRRSKWCIERRVLWGCRIAFYWLGALWRDQ